MKIQKFFSLSLIAVALMTSACATQTASTATPTSSTIQQFARADGSSMAQAIKIRENDTMRGIAAENAWLQSNLPQYRKIGQALLKEETGIYDEITVQAADGSTRKVYFEISDFFGRMGGTFLQ
ncbi:hypothetical protein [Wielerella bovis]|uniref:hypothetical protein n=1 Tax=Wielerella bovis TaxID=2917790 RepID=UPI0020187034|nr:hypothetical protein [Wielerella bovis]ULJ61272.1 hypothetical protein MIS44_05360 [Wielerella bovis]